MANGKRQEIEAKVKEILAKDLGTDIEKISNDKKLVEDLGMDSFASVELMFALEDKMGIEISDEDALNLKTVEDVIVYVLSRLSGKENKAKI